MNHAMHPSDRPYRILMLLENESIPEDCRVMLEAEALRDAGYCVTVICPTGQRSQKSENLHGIQVYRYPKPWELPGVLGYVWEYGYSLSMMFVLSFYVLVRRGFDCVHVHTPPDLTALVAIFYQFLGKRFVFDHHDLSPELYQARGGSTRQSFLYRLLRFFERIACRRADRLIATNESQRAVQIERCGAEASRCFVVRNGPNEMFLDFDATDKTTNEPLRLGYVGVIGIQDGVEYMVHAIHRLKTHYRRNDFTAVIVGSGPALDGLRELANRLGVNDLLHFTGMIPFASVPAQIAAFDICLTPDPSNAYNDSCTTIKTMEYMALRKPTVCFRTRENEITAGESALYADDNCIDQYADRVLELMNSPELRRKMGAIARRRVEDGLTWAHQSEVLLELYHGLSGRPTSHPPKTAAHRSGATHTQREREEVGA